MLLSSADRPVRSIERENGFSPWPKNDVGFQPEPTYSDRGSPSEGTSAVLTVAGTLASTSGCLLSVQEADGRVRMLAVTGISSNVAAAVLSSEPAALVGVAPNGEVRPTWWSGNPALGERVGGDRLSGGFLFRMVLDRDSERTWVLTVIRNRVLGPFSDAEIGLFNDVAPALQALLRQERRSRERAAISEMVGGSLDCLTFGLLLVDSERRVLWSNAPAREILASCKALHLVGNRLRAREPRRELILRDLVHELADACPGENRALAVSCNARSHRQLVFVRLDGEAPGGGGAVTAVFLSGTDVADLSAPLIRELYGLTPVEAEVARLICLGLTPTEVAGRLRLSVHTVRDYLKPIFQKIGVNRQADMVRIATGFAGLLRMIPSRRS